MQCLLSFTQWFLSRFKIDNQFATSVTNYKVKNLTEKEADVLKYFILHSHRVIGREEFSQAIWKNAYAENTTINNVIQKLRRELGCDAKSPKFIKTIQKILKRPKKCIFTFT